MEEEKKNNQIPVEKPEKPQYTIKDLILDGVGGLFASYIATICGRIFVTRIELTRVK